MVHERHTGERFALRDLRLVVREDEVGAATVEVERRSVLVHRHRGALDVPTRSPDTERRAPRGLVRQRRLPEHEVERCPPVRIIGIAAARPGEAHHLLFVVVRELTEAVERRDIEVRGAGGQVRVARLEQAADEVDDARDGFRCPRLGDWRPHLERGHVAVEARHLGFGELEVRDTELARLGQDRVVDVGDVADHAHLVPEILQAADQQVVGEVRRGVAEVRRVVRRDAAHVHAHRLRRLERHDRASCRVVQPDAHRRETLDRGEAQAGPHLVADVHGQQHGRERLHPDRVAQ